MKRFLSIMLVVVMLLSTLMLTSCDPIGSVKGFVNKILGREVGVKDAPRTTITLEEWLATGELTNYTIVMDEGDGYKLTIWAADNIAKIEYIYEGYINQTFAYDFDNQCYVTQTSIGWLGYKTSDLIIDIEEIKLGANMPFGKSRFETLVYDEDGGFYYIENSSSIWRYYFEDGKLVNMVVSSTTGLQVKSEVKNIGTTAIERPEYTIINDGKVDPSKAGADVRTTVTSEDILAILESRNLTASTAIGEFDELMGYALELTIKLAGNDLELIASVEDETYKQYVTAIEGDFYSIEPYKDAYLATGMDMSVDDLNEAIAELDINEVIELLVYNEEGRYYEFEIEGFKLYFYFENGQLVQFVLVGDIGLGEESEVIVKISDVGTTKVDIPEYTIGDTPPVIID